MDYSCAASSSRPTLPPLHTLNLPIPPSRTGSPAYDDSDDYKLCRLLQNTWIHNRQASISSSATSRSPSPIMGAFSAATRPSLSPLPTRLGMAPTNARADLPAKVRLMPCSFESADAYVYVPPSSSISSSSSLSPSPSSPPASPKVSGTIQRPLLLVGSAAKQLREPNQKIAKGARVHPYRIVPSARTFRPPRNLLL